VAESKFQNLCLLQAVVICLAGFLTSCELYSVNPTPAPALSGDQDDGEAFRNAPANDRAGKSPEEPWWETFNDRPLRLLVELSLARNPDIKAVSRRIDQAGSRLVQAGSTLYPQIDGSGQFRREWDLNGDVDDDASLGLLLDWELDVWGRIRSGRNARVEEYDAAREDWLAARLLLTAGVAEAWFGLVEQYQQRQLINEQIDLNRTLLSLTRLRFGQGQGSSVDILQQQQQLEATEALVPDIEARIEEFELVLDSLTGSVSGKRPRFASDRRLVSPPSYPETGVPSDLLELRPDLRSRRSSIRALDQEVGEAIADCLARFAIGGSVGLAGTPSFEALVGDAIAGALVPIIDGGNRKAEVARRKSRVLEEVDLYTAAYLDAIREVETALSNEREISRRVILQEKQLSTARKLLEESRIRYSRGLNDYLPVLDAVSRVQQLERNLLTSRRERLSARVALHRAIGGPMPERAG